MTELSSFILAKYSISTERYVRFFLALKVLLFTVLVPGSVTLYFPHLLLSRSGALPEPTSLVVAVSAVIGVIVGLTIYLRCAWDFAVDGLGTPAPIDPPKKLVVSGLYRRTRNPMYLGVLIVLLSECVLFGDLRLAAYAGVIGLIFHGFVVFHEEPILAARFGQSYRDFCAEVPRWGWALRPYCESGR